MKRLTTLVIQFYRPMLMWNAIFSIIGLIIVSKNGVTTIGNTLPIKALGYGIAMGYQYLTTNKVYFYYRNAGYSIRRMYAYAFTADLLVYFLSITFYALSVYGYTHLKS